MQVLKKRLIWGAIYLVLIVAFIFLLLFLADQKYKPRSYMIITEDEIGNPDSVSVWCGLMVDPIVLDAEQSGRVIELALKAVPEKIRFPNSQYQTRFPEYVVVIYKGTVEYLLSFYADEIYAKQTDPWIHVTKNIYETEEAGSKICIEDWSCYFSMPMEDYSKL